MRISWKSRETYESSKEYGMEKGKYTLNSAKHASKMAEWRIRIGKCRNSGKTVRNCCKENHISVKTYYRWQRIISDVESENRSIEPQKTGEIEFAEIPQIRIESNSQQAVMVIRKGNRQIELQNNANLSLIKQIMQMVVQNVWPIKSRACIYRNRIHQSVDGNWTDWPD